MSGVPESIKHVAQPYYQRGQELLTINPLITYFCKLYVIQAAIATNLHQTDNAVAQFVGSELDAVETLKAQLTTSTEEKQQDSNTDAADAAEENRQVINNVDHKGFEYIRDFATSILDSAYTDILAQKSSRARTVPRLLAAATFLSLALAVFRPEDEPEALKQEARERVKFAKWHAARIARAEKNGEDPNTYVPPEVEALRRAEEQATTAERAVDAAEEQQIGNVNDEDEAEAIDKVIGSAGAAEQKPVGAAGDEEEDEDEREARELLSRMRAEIDLEASTTESADDEGDLVLPSASSHDPGSVDATHDDGEFTLPSAASHDPAAEDHHHHDGLDLPAAASHDPATGPDVPFPTAPSSAASHNPGSIVPPVAPVSRPPAAPKPAYSPPPLTPPAAVRSVSATRINHSSGGGGNSHTRAEIDTILSNSEIFTKSQKHAKFAISALNYEDVSTAIRELNQALELLHQVKQD